MLDDLRLGESNMDSQRALQVTNPYVPGTLLRSLNDIAMQKYMGTVAKCDAGGYVQSRKRFLGTTPSQRTTIEDRARD